MSSKHWPEGRGGDVADAGLSAAWSLCHKPCMIVVGLVWDIINNAGVSGDDGFLICCLLLSDDRDIVWQPTGCGLGLVEWQNV